MFSKLINNLVTQNRKKSLTKDEIADLLQLNPELLDEFERAYEKHALSAIDNEFFGINSKQASMIKEVNSEDSDVDTSDIERRIVNELLAQTQVYSYDRENGVKIENILALPNETLLVTNEEINELPIRIRPELTGTLMKVDINEKSYPHLLYFYKESIEQKDKKKAQQAYHMFRQGLDILDLDGITYEIIGTNPNSMGFWFPALVEAEKNLMERDRQCFFKIPSTKVVKVPITLLQLTRNDYMNLAQTTLNIVNKWAYKAFSLNEKQDYFIKTGTYSSKFDFRNAKVAGAKEVKELGEYLLFIHHQALMMAGPLTQPSIYGVSTTNEWVVREYIDDLEGNPTIYKGLPLHTEYRIFVDCDTDEVIGISPYWEPETMKNRFSNGSDADSPHMMHDYIIYKAHEKTLMSRYEQNKNKIVEEVSKLVKELDLSGQWSLDIMQNGEDFWIIDMAIAENSAFYSCVPVVKRRKSKENWIPRLSDVTN